MTNFSIQKETILSVLAETKSHPTAEWVYEQVKLQIPNISLGTVYRNLGKLVESGEIIKVVGDFEKDRFDGNNIRHSHLICTKCGKLVDYDIPKELDNEILTFQNDGKVVDYALTYYGLCPFCNGQLKKGL